MSDAHVRIDELLAHRAWLERLARTLIRDPQAAEDAVQNTWISALRRPPSRATCVRAWLRTVLRNEAIRNLRSSARCRDHERLASSASLSEYDAASQLEIAEQLDEARRALDRLREPYRSTLRMLYGDSLSSAEIAHQLRIPAATVRWRVKRGMHALRESLGHSHEHARADARARHVPPHSFPRDT